MHTHTYLYRILIHIFTRFIYTYPIEAIQKGPVINKYIHLSCHGIRIDHADSLSLGTYVGGYNKLHFRNLICSSALGIELRQWTCQNWQVIALVIIVKIHEGTIPLTEAYFSFEMLWYVNVLVVSLYLFFSSKHAQEI